MIFLAWVQSQVQNCFTSSWALNTHCTRNRRVITRPAATLRGHAYGSPMNKGVNKKVCRASRPVGGAAVLQIMQFNIILNIESIW